MSSLQETKSDFASVVRVIDRLEQWSKVVVDEPLAQMHAKFWGKSMEDEEREWRNTPLTPAIGGELEGDERMDVEVDDVSDTTIPGCYVLNIDVDGLEFSKIWIRAEYIRVYDFLEGRPHSASAVNNRAPGAIITGQPGIGEFSLSLHQISTKVCMVHKGKSVWVYYALRRRLAERKPVIWYREGHCFLFVKEGVYQSPPAFLVSYFRTFVWTLVDSDEASCIPSHLVAHGTRLFVIYSTSPHKERWSRMHKTVRQSIVVMNAWTRKEISYA